MSPAEYVEFISTRFMEEADPVRAEQQMAYMRGQFEYCGLCATKWYPMSKEIFKEHGMFHGKDLKAFVKFSYDHSYREVLYAGIEMMQRMLPYQTKSWISVLEKCITTHSWWDTVDWLSKLVGIHFKIYPELQHTYSYKWIEGKNMWLQRAAIIHQLFYRDETDEKLLFDLISRKAGDKELFIRKACGWALRQYSKTNPARVTWYVEHHPLSPLSAREALRLMK